VSKGNNFAPPHARPRSEPSPIACQRAFPLHQLRAQCPRGQGALSDQGAEGWEPAERGVNVSVNRTRLHKPPLSRHVCVHPGPSALEQFERTQAPDHKRGARCLERRFQSRDARRSPQIVARFE